MARSSWVEPGPLGLVLAALMPANRLVMEVMIQTGLRVSDVLRLTRKQVERGRFTVRELKTGKTRRIYLPRALQLRLLQTVAQTVPVRSVSTSLLLKVVRHLPRQQLHSSKRVM